MLHLHSGISDYQHCCVYRILGFRVQRLSINTETEATQVYPQPPSTLLGHSFLCFVSKLAPIFFFFGTKLNEVCL